MNFYTRKKIIHKIFLLLFVSLGFNAFGQNAVLVREAVQDSSEYFGNLKNVNDELFYTGGEIRPPHGVGGFCGNGGPRDFREAHIYKYDAKQDESKKLFHHDLENNYRHSSLQQLDSSEFYHRRIFVPLSDTSGIFIRYASHTANYWFKRGNDYEKVILPDKTSMWYQYKWFDGKLLIKGRDSLAGNRTWLYIDASDFQLKPLLNDTLIYNPNICYIGSEHIVFSGTSQEYNNAYYLFISDKKGTVHRFSSFPLEVIKPKFLGTFKGKVMYTLIGKKIEGQCIDKRFTNTELWEYDIKKNTSKRIHEFENAVSIFSAYEANGDLYFGHRYDGKNRIYKLSEGDITQNDKSHTLDDTYGYLHQFNNRKYFIGVDNEGVKRLYTLNKKDKINLVSSKYIHVNSIRIIGDRLIFVTNENADKHCLRFYQIIEGSNKIEQITDVCLAHNYKRQRYLIFTVGENVYFAFRYYVETENSEGVASYSYPYKKRTPPQIDLFRLEGSELKLVKADIKSIRNVPGPLDFIDMTIIKDDLYIVSRANKKDRFNQLWKITNDSD